MPIRITCPRCQATYSVAEDLQARNILCRECEQPLRAEGPLVGRSWREVSAGLRLLKWSAEAKLAGVAVSCLVLLIALSMLNESPAQRAGRPADADAIDIFVSVLVGFPALLSVILGLVGQLRCCSVPAVTGARLPAVLSICFKVFALLLSGPLALEVLLRDKRSAGPEWWLPVALAIGGGALLAEILNLVFFYSIGRSLREPAVINRVERLGIAFSFVTVFAVIGGIILAGDLAALFPSRAELASPSSVAFQSQQAMVQVALAAGVFVQVALVGIALVLLFDLDLIHVARNALASRLGDDKNERENKPVIEIPAAIETTAIPCAPAQTTESNVMSETTGPPP